MSGIPDKLSMPGKGSIERLGNLAVSAPLSLYMSPGVKPSPVDLCGQHFTREGILSCLRKEQQPSAGLVVLQKHLDVPAQA